MSGKTTRGLTAQQLAEAFGQMIEEHTQEMKKYAEESRKAHAEPISIDLRDFKHYSSDLNRKIETMQQVANKGVFIKNLTRALIILSLLFLASTCFSIYYATQQGKKAAALEEQNKQLIELIEQRSAKR